MKPAVLSELERVYDLQLQPQHYEKISLYLALLRHWNARLNLMAVHSDAELLRHHFFESFWAGRHFLEADTRVADVGSGAGFPGLAMKLYRPTLRVTLIERRSKKSVFLREASRKLGLEVRCFHGSGEDFPFWADIEVAALRALRPSGRLLALLQRSACRLLLLHGQLPDLPSSLRVVRQLQVPGSQRRFATLFEPDPAAH